MCNSRAVRTGFSFRHARFRPCRDESFMSLSCGIYILTARKKKRKGEKKKNVPRARKIDRKIFNDDETLPLSCVLVRNARGCVRIFVAAMPRGKII